MRRFLAHGILLLSSTLMTVYVLETYLAVARPFRPRSISRRVANLRRRGVRAYPAYIPAFRFTVPSGPMPLSGVRLAPTIMGGDDGSYTRYDSDEFGFRNPSGLWRPGLQVAVLGDSFVQGYNAPQGTDLPSLMRKRYPRTLNLGMTGTGQLVQLAIVREYLREVRPARVVLVYYEGNDIGDTANEILNERLQRYYFDDDFTQELMEQFDTIDPQLRAFLDTGVEGELEREARQTPPSPTPSALLVGIARLTSLRALAETARQRWGVPRPSRKRATHGCDTRYERLPMKRVELDEESPKARATNDDPQVRGPAIVDFLARNQLLLGRAVFGPDIVLLPRQAYRTILVKMREAVEAWGGRLSFVYLPSHLSVSDPHCDPNRRSVEEIVTSTGIPFIDASVALRAHAYPESLFVLHLTPEGNRVVADYVLERLEAIDAPEGRRGTAAAGHVR